MRVSHILEAGKEKKTNEKHNPLIAYCEWYNSAFISVDALEIKIIFWWQSTILNTEEIKQLSSFK